MKVLITGAQGQLGRALIRAAPPWADIAACGRAEFDLIDEAALLRSVERIGPQLLINAAAYTAVDRAESDEANALAINSTAVGNLARVATDIAARLIHVSTDFVFDGAANRPYVTGAPTSPINAYGRTKLAGEQAAGPGALVVRTAWVYAAEGQNFVRTMLRLMAEQEEVRVVADQVGTPTYAVSLAQAIWRLAEGEVVGIQHFTDSGVASWYDFAVAIQEEALALGALSSAARILPISTSDFPTPARRPAYSVLDKAESNVLLGGPAPHWRVNLRHMLQELIRHG